MNGYEEGKYQALRYALEQKRSHGTMGPMPYPDPYHADCAKYQFDYDYANGFNAVRDRLNPYLERKYLRNLKTA